MTRTEVEGSRLKWLALFAIASVGLHLLALWLLPRRVLDQPFAAQKPIELVPVEIQRPPPPEPKPAPLQQPKVAPHPHRAALAKPAPKPPPPDQPAPPPDQKPPSKPVPQIVGLTMSSTTTAGSFSAPVGNTQMGAVGPTAHAPTEAKQGGGLVPLAEVDSGPVPLDEVRIPYPAQARQDGIEGTVTLMIVVDDSGKVTSAKVIGGPGHGLNEAALEAIRRFHFKPAIREGKPVAVETRFAYTFELY